MVTKLLWLMSVVGMLFGYMSLTPAFGDDPPAITCRDHCGLFEESDPPPRGWDVWVIDQFSAAGVCGCNGVFCVPQSHCNFAQRWRIDVPLTGCLATPVPLVCWGGGSSHEFELGVNECGKDDSLEWRFYNGSCQGTGLCTGTYTTVKFKLRCGNCQDGNGLCF